MWFSSERGSAARVVLSLSSLAMAACSIAPLGATDTALASAKAEAAPGYDAYERECASCHGHRGEGLVGSPPVMGVGALPLYPRDQTGNSATVNLTQEAQQQQYQTLPPGQQTRPPFRTAQDLYDFVSKKMPLPRKRAGSLSAEQYWAIVNYILIGHGVKVPAGGVTAENAAEVKLAAQ